MSKDAKAKILNRYQEKCGSFEVSHDQDSGKAYIHTERFTAEPICADKVKFDDLSKKLRELHSVTFSDPEVVKTFCDCAIFDKQGFEGIVQRNSCRADRKYPFLGFMVSDNENDAVVGYQAISNSSDTKSW